MSPWTCLLSQHTKYASVGEATPTAKHNWQSKGLAGGHLAIRTQMPASTLGRGISAKRRTQQDFQDQERKENPGARAAFRNTFVYM